MSWYDAAAVKVIKGVMRVKLMQNLFIDSENDPVFIKMKTYVTPYETEEIFCAENKYARTRRFLRYITKRMNTEAFANLLSALEHMPILQKELLQSYITEGGDPRVSSSIGDGIILDK